MLPLSSSGHNKDYTTRGPKKETKQKYGSENCFPENEARMFTEITLGSG